jgi:putative protease
MATKDLNMSYNIKELLDSGVKSLKVEGRMRSAYYLATVISSYRRLIDAYYENKLTKELIEKENKILSRVANRETSTHYYLKKADYTDQYYTGRQENSNQDFLAQVIDYDKDNNIVIMSERNYFEENDLVEIFTPNGDIYRFNIDKVYDENMNDIKIARHPEQVIKIKFDKYIPKDSMMRKVVL